MFAASKKILRCLFHIGALTGFCVSSAYALDNFGNLARLIVNVTNVTHMPIPLLYPPKLVGAVQVAGPFRGQVLYPNQVVNFEFVRQKNSRLRGYDVGLVYGLQDTNFLYSGCAYNFHCDIRVITDNQQFCSFVGILSRPLESLIKPVCAHVTVRRPTPLDTDLRTKVLVRIEKGNTPMLFSGMSLPANPHPTPDAVLNPNPIPGT